MGDGMKMQKNLCVCGQHVENHCVAVPLGKCDFCSLVKEAVSGEGSHRSLPQGMG